MFVNGTRAGEIPGTGANIINLVPGTSYSFTVRARNANNVFSGNSNTLTASTLSGAPSAPPVPTNLRLRDADDALTDTQIRLVWNASAGATSYELYQNGAWLMTAQSTAVILRNRAPNTSFTFTVRAVSANGTSGHSAAFTVRTLPGAAPAAPTGLRLRDADDALTDTQIRLVWNASAGATSYDLYGNGSLAGSVTSAAAIFRNLTPNTNFTFTVRARNAGGVSGHSAAFTVRTLAGTELEVSTTRINVPANGNSHPVTVTSNAAWTLTRSHNWIRLSTNGGTNTETFNVSVDPNEESSPRPGTVTVIAGAMRRVIEVVQEAIGGGSTPRFIWPVIARNLTTTRVFTPRHYAVDIIPINDPANPCWPVLPPPYLASEGATVVAAAKGVVSHIMRNSSTAGNAFAIAHGGGYFTRYVHLHNSQLNNVSLHGEVSQGEPLGMTGRTGDTDNSPGHLHFEVIRVAGRENASDLDDAERFSGHDFQGTTVRNCTVNAGGTPFSFERLNPVTLLP